MNAKALMNEVIEEVNGFGFKLRTNWEKDANGNIRGTGFYSCPNTASAIRSGSNSTRGQCAEESLQLYKKMKHMGAKVINGVLRSKRNEWRTVNECRGMPIYHCWVEVGDKVYDYSNGERVIADRDIYYQIKRVGKTIEVVPTITATEIGFDTAEEKKRAKFYKEVRKQQRALGYDCGF